MKNTKKYDQLKLIVEKLCLEAIQKQKKRESTVGYGLDDYTEGRIVGGASLARKIIREIRDHF
jgi:hypothetical protein